jgi:hypothetical protein
MMLAPPAVVLQKPDCTLEASEGTRQSMLSNNVAAKMTWSACTSLAREVVFEWPLEQGSPATPRAILEQAALLVREWERVTDLLVSPFGDVSKALAARAAQADAYQLGDDIPVTDNGVAGWDGVWVKLNSAIPRPQLIVHYWANP